MARKRTSKKKQKQQKQIVLAVLFIILIAAVGIFGGGEISGLFGHKTNSTPLAPLVTDEHAFSMHVVDCGQGDAILLSKDGHFALVDAGETMSPSDREARDKILAYLESVNVSKLDFVLITHQDYDHIGSILDVLKKYPVATVYDNGVEHTSATYEKLMTYILDNGINYEIVREGDKINSTWEDVSIEVLSPPQDLIMSGSSPDINENSIVLKVTYGKVSYLLTGDAGKDAEEYILSTSANINSDVLKAGHHGSRTSSSADFMKAVTPNVVVISVGDGNSYGHPHIEAMNRFVKFTDLIYRTDIDGDIVVTTDGSVYSVNTRNEHVASRELFAGDGTKVSA
ncbi:MAG: ComEC/Rec2 family competence protein [Methanocorpusculum sp.]|nr:ComEC/Rec2 family competence protein [Methanocorpusculum sp.]